MEIPKKTPNDVIEEMLLKKPRVSRDDFEVKRETRWVDGKPVEVDTVYLYDNNGGLKIDVPLTD